MLAEGHKVSKGRFDSRYDGGQGGVTPHDVYPILQSHDFGVFGGHLGILLGMFGWFFLGSKGEKPSLLSPNGGFYGI